MTRRDRLSNENWNELLDRLYIKEPEIIQRGSKHGRPRHAVFAAWRINAVILRAAEYYRATRAAA